MFCDNARMVAEDEESIEIEPPMTPPASKTSNCEEIVSLGEIKYWKPTCNASIKPHVGQQFIDFEAAGHFYDEYAAIIGFDTRRGTSKRKTEKVT